MPSAETIAQPHPKITELQKMKIRDALQQQRQCVPSSEIITQLVHHIMEEAPLVLSPSAMGAAAQQAHDNQDDKRHADKVMRCEMILHVLRQAPSKTDAVLCNVSKFTRILLRRETRG